MTQRDWQKDMEMCEAATPGPWKARSWTVPTADQYNVTSEHDASEIFTAWQGARYPGGPEVSADQAKLNAIVAAEARTALPYWLQEAKERGEREQQLRELMKDALGCMVMFAGKEDDHVQRIVKAFRTLYPDTPAPKEEEENKCRGCGSHMVPQWGGDEGPESHWEECQNPDCDYEEGDNQ
ncbi:hypothetical protein ACDZ28_04115 [Paenibacillus sp. RS8]|uniref:hypothetical protein n=1 Tax=Paenibacillus sp. RS8 TaxID=3242681 RepID=UPI0035C1B556